MCKSMIDFSSQIPHYITYFLGMAIGRVFSDTRLTPPLMGWGSILINGFGTGLGIFF